MSRGGGGKPSPGLPALPAAVGGAAAISPPAARDDAVALLRLAGLDTERERLRKSLAAVLEPLDRERSDLAALGELIEKDRPPQGTEREAGDILDERRRRLLRNQVTHAELAEAPRRDQAEVLAMSSELQRKTAKLAEERDAALACASAPLRGRYEAAVQKGLHPALVAVP